jgi:hypothetical protein
VGDVSEYGVDSPILPILDALKGTRDWKDAVATALRRGGQNLGLVPTPERIRQAEGSKSVMSVVSEEDKKQNSRDMMMGFGSGGIAKGALIGALRSGGRPDLYATHGSQMNPRLRDIPKQLTSPSFGIQSYEGGAPDSRIPFYGSDNMLYVPRVGAIDPAQNPSVIYNRDSYTPSGAAARDISKWGRESLKFEEGTTPSSHSQVASIMQSPEFVSAKQYENSPYGARLLAEEPSGSDDHISGENAIRRAFYQYGDPNDKGVQRTLILTKEAATNGDKNAQEILRILSTQPADYAEAKFRGNFGLTPERLAGVVMPEKAFQRPVRDRVWTASDWAGMKDRYVNALRARNIPFHIVGEDEGAQAVVDLADRAAPYGGR